jgi:hypothetical protein
MLYAKINPTATYTTQVSPFSSTTIQCSYMTAYARPYAAGAEKTNFQVQFGNEIKDDQGVVINVTSEYSTNVTMTAVELANWGTNDSALLTDIATKIGTTATEFIEVLGNNI